MIPTIFSWCRTFHHHHSICLHLLNHHLLFVIYSFMVDEITGWIKFRGNFLNKRSLTLLAEVDLLYKVDTVDGELKKKT